MLGTVAAAVVWWEGATHRSDQSPDAAVEGQSGLAEMVGVSQRTVHREQGTAELHGGSGVVWRDRQRQQLKPNKIRIKLI